MMRSFRVRLIVVGLVLAGVGGLASGCAQRAGASGDGRTIRYQDSPGLVNFAELAKALGYLPGITLDDVGVVQGGPQALLALATGQVDMAGAFTGAAANVISNGAPLKAVIAYYGSDPKVYDEVLVKDGSPITKPQQLIGKKVAVNTLGAQYEALLDTWFRKSGMTTAQIRDVTLVPLPAINTEAALRNGQVDAAILGGSLRIAAVKAGGLRPLVKDTQIIGPYNGGSYEMTDAWLHAHPAVAHEFVGGMARAVVWLQHHTTAEVLARYTPWLNAHGETDDAKALALWTGSGIATRGGLLRDRDYAEWTSWLRSKGLLTGDARLSSIYTNRYNPYAKTENH